MRTVTELSKMNGKVYVYVPEESVRMRFLQDAEDEGFLFGDGEKPTKRTDNNLYVINPDHTMHYVGWVGHMAFQSAKTIGEQKLIRVDYEKYVSRDDNYNVIV